MQGLEKDYIKKVCWKGGKGKEKCRFLRYVMINGRAVPICAKNTASGIKHSKKIDELLCETPEELADDVIHSADNCEGRAGEFMCLLPQKSFS